jgi:crossover junction endodeoxyribonuclease RuvC
MSKSVIAIDPGYDRVGFALFSGETLQHSECFVPKTKDFSERLKAIAERICELTDEFKPESLAMEKLFFSNNAKTALQVAEARGAIIVTASQLGLPLFEYSPQEVKIAVASVGNADKKQVIAMVERLVSLPPRKRFDDEYDAIAVGLCHQAHHRRF